MYVISTAYRNASANFSVVIPPRVYSVGASHEDVHLLQATGLLLCRLLGLQHHHRCALSQLHLHRRPLCIDNYVVQSLVHLSTPSLHHVDQIFSADIERFRLHQALSPPYLVLGRHAFEQQRLLGLLAFG